MSPITIGTTTSKPGTISYGWFDAVPLPTGGMDRFPVIIAQGKDTDGPVFWITTGIHGGEHTGPIIVQQFITQALVDRLHGTLIAIPALNPAGLRIKQRSPYYLDDDPNRLFPKPGTDKEPQKDRKPRPAIEIAYERLYKAIVATNAVGLIDLHNAWYGSIPFIFRDPVLYHAKGQQKPNRQQAQMLQDQTGEMLNAVGLTVINEFSAHSYTRKNLHRSVSGSVLNKAGIPAMTIELGSSMHVDEGVIEACMAGLRNALRWAGMLEGENESITGIPIIQPGYPVRHQISPYAPQAGIVHHLIRPGQMIEKGRPLVRMTDIFGRPVGKDDGLLRSEYQGFVIGWFHGVVRYQGEPILSLAIRDDGEMIAPFPDI
ncbi:MAG: succinylglutamate desuccinylase/aspartoacylase family protein [Anaerolineae bacterium]|nr:succinylglutamate desuccinylase/aspartoacylase family protein [Anaerolineae bacterium]